VLKYYQHLIIVIDTAQNNRPVQLVGNDFLVSSILVIKLGWKVVKTASSVIVNKNKCVGRW